jgi:tRNA (cmo5U34)-methyltransferase
MGGYNLKKDSRYVECNAMPYHEQSTDNATAHSASEYDQNIRKSIPLYDLFHEATINIVTSCNANPSIWVDIGCGTGTLVEQAYSLFPATMFILTDPSAAMLEIAAEKLKGKDRVTILEPTEAAQLSLAKQADVITAIQSLHYCKPKQRKDSIMNCFRQLKTGGVFVTFENVKPLTERGIEIGKDNWRRFEVRAGKSVEDARKHVARFGVEYYPLTIEEHLELLRFAGFSTVELLWYSYMQAGFYCVK